jgi:hypothetical protein
MSPAAVANPILVAGEIELKVSVVWLIYYV